VIGRLQSVKSAGSLAKLHKVIKLLGLERGCIVGKLRFPEVLTGRVRAECVEIRTRAGNPLYDARPAPQLSAKPVRSLLRL
jgi:hypothetical protein